MEISGYNFIIKKDNDIDIIENKEYNITGEKIEEMFENHKKTFSYYFSEHQKYKYYDVMTIYNTSTYYFHENLINYTLLKKLQIKSILVAEDKIGYTMSIYGENYYHFLTDELPNIIKLNMYDENINIISSYNERYIKQTLDIFNFKNKIIKINEDDCLQIKQCIKPNISISGKPCRKELNLIREYLKNKNIIEFKKTNIGVIIKRNEYERKILNFEEMCNYLKDNYKQINWVVFENLNMIDTLELYSKCSIIVAPHGAGLTNMLFAPNETNIIEFMPYSDPNECYYHLASMLNHNYNCIVVEDTGKQNGKQMNIKMEFLDKILKRII